MLDQYFNYLRNYAAIGEDEHAKAMDILAGYDMEDLKRMAKNKDYGLFDGEDVLEKVDNDRDELLALQALTGKTYKELINIVKSDENKGRRR